MASDSFNALVADQHSMMVTLWDLGPAEAEMPARPETPKAKEGSPEHDLAMIDFRADLATYETALKTFSQAKKDFAAWQATYGGPYEFTAYSVDAREHLEIEPSRYMVSDDRLPNHGLPKGRKAGHWHAAEQKRLEELKRFTAQQRARDPVFGTQGATV